MSQSPSSSSSQDRTAPSTQPTHSNHPELPAQPPPVQATTASIYSPSRHDDFQPHVDHNDDLDYPAPHPDDDAGASLLPPPTFHPLFTLISDPVTNETIHPEVYYVFSDDADNEREGHDVATVAALRALDQTAKKVKRRQGQLAPAASADDDGDVEERYVILDLEPNTDNAGLGLKVTNVASLSPSWAVTSATLRNAPTFEEEPEENGESLMALLEGVELHEPEPSSRRHSSSTRKDEAERKAEDILQEASKRGGGILQGMEEMWRALHHGIGVLGKVVGETEGNDAKDCAMT
jgi:hypothetical protein